MFKVSNAIERKIEMQVKPYEAQYAERVAKLLNEHLPFQEENAVTVEEAGGVRYVYIDGEEVVGYIAGYELQNSKEEMPYFEDELYEIHQVAAEKNDFLYKSFSRTSTLSWCRDWSFISSCIYGKGSANSGRTHCSWLGEI